MNGPRSYQPGNFQVLLSTGRKKEIKSHILVYKSTTFMGSEAFNNIIGVQKDKETRMINRHDKQSGLRVPGGIIKGSKKSHL